MWKRERAINQTPISAIGIKPPLGLFCTLTAWLIMVAIALMLNVHGVPAR